MIFLFLKIDFIYNKKYIKILFLPFKKFFLVILVMLELSPPHLSHALSPTYERNVLMHEMKCKRGAYMIQKICTTTSFSHTQIFVGLIPLALFPSFQWVLFIGHSGEAYFFFILALFLPGLTFFRFFFLIFLHSLFKN